MRTTRLFTLSTLILILVFSVQGFAQEKQVDWEAFSTNLEVALRTAHPGLERSAMQQVIKYADKLTLEDGVYRIGRIFCYGTDARERRLALVALARINSLKSMAYIYNGLVTEGSKSIVKQGKGIIHNYCLANTNVTETDIQLAAVGL